MLFGGFHGMIEFAPPPDLLKYNICSNRFTSLPKPSLLCSTWKVPGRKRMPLASELVIIQTIVTTSPNLMGTIVSWTSMSMVILCQLPLFLCLRVVGKRWSSVPHPDNNSCFSLFSVISFLLSAPLLPKLEDFNRNTSTSEVKMDNYKRRVQSAEH